MANISQEEIITIKLGKNFQDKMGSEKTIGGISKRLGALSDEEFEEYRQKGVNLIKKESSLLTESFEVVKEVLEDEDFQEVLEIDSPFQAGLWHVRREHDIAKYFAGKEAIKTELLGMMKEAFKEGLKDNYGNEYKFDTTIVELESFIKDFEELQKELGVENKKEE